MNMIKITHIDSDILHANGHSVAGATDTYVDAKIAGTVISEPWHYKMIDGVLVYQKDEAMEREIIARNICRLIDSGTPIAIEDFAYNAKTYKLTPDVIQQVQEIKSLLDTSPDVPGEFPLQINLGVDKNGQDDTVEAGTINGFNNALNAITAHIRAKREEARVLKQALMSMTLEELQAWSDSRF